MGKYFGTDGYMLYVTTTPSVAYIARVDENVEVIRKQGHAI